VKKRAYYFWCKCSKILITNKKLYCSRSDGPEKLPGPWWENTEFLINSLITRKDITVRCVLYKKAAFLSSDDDYRDNYMWLTMSNSNS